MIGGLYRNTLWQVKRKTAAILMTAMLAFVLSACGNTAFGNTSGDSPNEVSDITAPTGPVPTESSVLDAMSTVNIQVGSQSFIVALYDNDSARALLAQLPLTLDMSELNGNEKYYYLPERLPTASEQVGSIQTGDLMLYGSDCLVLFYEGFSTSYSYTRLGYIADAGRLAEVLGSGNVEVVFTTNN